MSPEEAERIVMEGVEKARAFCTIGADQPKGSPLFEEMRRAALEAMAFLDDDEVVDAFYD